MGTIERKKREALQRRKGILAAARKVFWQKGYADATMAQIAQAAELAPGTLYLYFTGKDALYVELLSEGYELLLDRLQAENETAISPIIAAAGLIDVFFNFAREHPQYFDIIFFVLRRENTKAWQDNFPAEQFERLERWRSACHQAAAGVLERAHFSNADKRQDVIDALWGMLAGVVFYFGNTDSFDPVAAAAKSLLLGAIFGPDTETNIGPDKPDE